MTNTAIEINPAIHILSADLLGQSHVVVTAGPWQEVADGVTVGHIKRESAGWDESGVPFYNYVPVTRAGVRHNYAITREGAAEWLVEHYLAQRQDVYLMVRVTVDREMWDLAYGEMADEAGRAEDVRSYVAERLNESAQARPGGEGGIQELDVDHT